MSFMVTYCQTKGIVKDKGGLPIEMVNIFYADQNLLIQTNNDGSFAFDQEIPKSSYLHIYKHGFASQFIRYKDQNDLTITLDQLHVDLDEVGVSESYSQLGNSKLTNIEKKSVDFIEANSMAEGITELSGVDMISSGLGIQKIVVRGLSGMRVVTYLNGMQINNQQWANDHGIGFTDLGLNEVELIKGSSALKYGSEAIGGLLFFKDHPFISNDKITGYISTRLNNSSYLSNSQFGIKWNKQNFYFDLYGEYSRSTDYRLPNNTFLFNSRFYQHAIKFSIAHRYKKLQNIFRYHFHSETTGIPGHVHSKDPASVDIDDLTSDYLVFESDYKETRPNQYVNNQLLIYELKYLINNFKFSLYAGQFINHLAEWEKWTRPGFDLLLTNTQLRPNITYYLGGAKNFTLNLGAQISVQENKNKEADDKLIPDASSSSNGYYAIIDFEKNNIGFNTGIRYDLKNIQSNDEMIGEAYDNTFKSTSFSNGLYYKLSDHIFRITYSGAYRAPHFAELFSNGVHHGTNRFEIGSRELDIEFSNQIDFKYQWSDDHLGIVFNPFVQYISDFISINPTENDDNGYKIYNYTQYENVELKGVEMNLHYHPHQLHNLHLEQSYSFLQAKNMDSEYGLALIPANSIKTKILFKKSKSYISAYHIYKFKQDMFAEYEELTEAYNVVNMNIGFDIAKKLNCILGINNLFNTEYSPHISRVRNVAGGVPNPGRFHNIKLKYEF